MTGGQAGRLRHAEHVMGTVVSFDVPACAGQDGPARAGEAGGSAGNRAGGALGQAVRWLHWVDGTFSPYREDSDVSRFGAGEVSLAQCAPELTEVLEACAAVSALSGGYFTTEPGGRFDPSGYVKGWAIERAAAMITAAGSAEHSVNGGGDVQCVGDRGSGQNGCRAKRLNDRQNGAEKAENYHRASRTPARALFAFHPRTGSGMGIVNVRHASRA